MNWQRCQFRDKFKETFTFYPPDSLKLVNTMDYC